MQGFTEADVTDQTGKTFVVTGANSGLGFEITRVLAARGARIILACRSEAKAEQAMARIRELTPGADLAFLAYDQGDLDSIHAAAATLVAGPRIDVLINNAGVMRPALARTKQGFEQHFGINHLGSFAFTALLLAKLSQAPSPRIVITGSSSHKTGVIDFDDLNAEKGYGRSPRYDDSKLASLLFLFELDRRLRAAHSPIIAVGCHPGLAMTNLAESMTVLRLLIPIFKLLRFNTAAMGAWPALQAATSAVTAGGYYGPIGFAGLKGASGPSDRAPNSVDASVAEKLWDRSVELTGVDPGLPPATDRTRAQDRGRRSPVKS